MYSRGYDLFSWIQSLQFFLYFIPFIFLGVIGIYGDSWALILTHLSINALAIIISGGFV
jgi:hypothetical protein